MLDIAVAQSVAPFESASDLREAHACLLEAFDFQLGEDASSAGETAAFARLESDIRQFLERGAATGVYLEEVRERTACQVLLDYWASSLERASLHAESVRLARFDAEELPDLKGVRSPYVGLEAFRDQDRTYFFGRESDTEELLAQVRDAPLVVVLGASGSGKSSLVMGGVLPVLQAEGTLRVVPPFVPGNAVLEHLVEAVLQSRGETGASPASLASALRENPQSVLALVGAETPPALITIDQFEEVFTLSSVEDREALAASLAQLLKAGHRAILTMREEFASRIVELSALSPYRDKARYSMRPMDYDELRAAVEKPAALVNLQFQEGIVDDLVKKVLGQPAALPLLQFTLRLLWQERDRNRITWEVYKKTGDPLNALKASADQFYDRLAPQTQSEVRRVLLELVRVDELLEAYRQPVPRSRLLQAGKANTEEVIALLAKKDYVRVTADTTAADAIVEVKHESLVRNWPRFVGWIDEKRIERRQRLSLSQAARRWAESAKPAEGLLTGWQLEEAKGFSDLSAVEEELVQASAQAVERTQREREDALQREAERNRRNAALVLAGALVVIVLIVLAGWFAWQARWAGEQAAVARTFAKELADRAQAQKFRADRAASEAKGLRENALKAALQASREQNRATALGREVEGQKRRAGELLREAESTRLVVNAERLQDTNYDASLLVNLEAVRAVPTLDTAAGLLRRFVSHPHLSAFLRGHESDVLGVAFSPDGRRLASAGADSTVILWDLDNRKPLATLEGHTDYVTSVAFSPDGKRLASAGADYTVILWDLDDRKPLATLEGHTDYVNSVAFSPDGKRLASASDDNSVILWDMDNFKELAVLTGHTDSVWDVAFSPNGKLLASASRDKTAILWDVESHKLLAPLKKHEDTVNSVAFSPDGTRLASASEDKTVILWDVESRQPGDPLKQGVAVVDLAFSPSKDETLLALAGADHTVILWDVESDWDVESNERLVLKGHTQGLWSVAFSPDGRRLASAGADGVILWNVAGRQPLYTEDENTMVLWDVDRHELLSTLKGNNNNSVLAVALTPDGNRLASKGRGDTTPGLWALDLNDLKAEACRTANRNLTCEEWEDYIGLDKPYHKTCEALAGPDTKCE